ncbi:unnamed protein product [Notodromas monacha]|uniref:Protoheme IX farnesyltransferase, mitochondrial n=1 Tax=Notodromas monacha TaxID=399045 RepID=A0A7R9GHK5_9CRUS|nr:unnamed protein product [Notodromas monacha]CAG0921450.1 unnamed protein product [Notodromas monacha]
MWKFSKMLLKFSATGSRQFSVLTVPICPCRLDHGRVFTQKVRWAAARPQAVPVIDPAKPVDEVVKTERKFVEEDSEPRERIPPHSLKLVGAVPSENLGWYECHTPAKKLPAAYLKLSKARLSALVITTAMGGYALAPGAFDPGVVILTCLGTGLLSASANAVNQTLEVPFDSQMDRTKNRVLVRRLITPLHAVSFALASAATGFSILWFGVNGLCAGLGLFNLFLYTSVYTPLKRVSIFNTWLGSVVGAVPPVMGWVACTGALDPGAIATGVVCSLAAPLLGVTTWTFAVDSLPLNAYLLYLSWRFHQDRDSKSSRKLFRYTLVYLPAVMMLMIISKREWKKHTQTRSASGHG